MGREYVSVHTCEKSDSSFPDLVKLGVSWRKKDFLVLPWVGMALLWTLNFFHLVIVWLEQLPREYMFALAAEFIAIFLTGEAISIGMNDYQEMK